MKQITIPELIDLVKAKYMDNPAVLAVADSLVTAQNTARAYSNSMFKADKFAGYERASVAETAEAGRGFSPMNHLSASMFDTDFKRMGALLEVGVLTTTLVVVLQRLGEEIEY